MEYCRAELCVANIYMYIMGRLAVVRIGELRNFRLVNGFGGFIKICQTTKLNSMPTSVSYNTVTLACQLPTLYSLTSNCKTSFSFSSSSFAAAKRSFSFSVFSTKSLVKEDYNKKFILINIPVSFTTRMPISMI